MRDTSGQPTDRFHLGGMTQTLLRGPTARNIPNARKTRRSAVPGRLNRADFRIYQATTWLVNRNLGHIAHDKRYADWRSDQRPDRPTEDRLRSRIGKQHHTRVIEDDNAVGILLNEKPDLRLVDSRFGGRAGHAHDSPTQGACGTR